MSKKTLKPQKTVLMSIGEASKTYGIPEGTLRSWSRVEDRPEIVTLFDRLDGCRRVFVNSAELDAALTRNRERRMETARSIDFR